MRIVSHIFSRFLTGRKRPYARISLWGIRSIWSQLLPSITTTVQGGTCGEARRTARRLAWECLARSLHSCVSSSHRSSSAGPNVPGAASPASPGRPPFTRGQALRSRDPGHLFPHSCCKSSRNAPPSRHMAYGDASPPSSGSRIRPAPRRPSQSRTPFQCATWNRPRRPVSPGECPRERWTSSNGIQHPKRQLFVDTYYRTQRAGKEKKSGSRTNDAKQERRRKGTAPKERKEKRIPLTPEARKERRRTNHKEKLAKAKASGLCRHCDEPAIEGQTRCDRCSEGHRLSGRVYGIKSRAKAKEAREMAQAMAPAENIPAGGPTKCRHCQDPPRPGQTRCGRCATRHNGYRRRSEAKKRSQAQNKDTTEERPR